MLKIFGTFFDSNAREISRIRPIVDAINEQEAEIQKLTDAQLKQKTAEFKTRLQAGETLDDLLVESFAVVREASRRVNKERHYDVQLIAAAVLHRGAVAEQKTGEGKTLSAIPALYLNALSGQGAHLVTVNDYLARRDAGWMGPVFHSLGLTTSAMIHDQSFLYDPEFVDKNVTDWRLRHLRPISRREAYQADITYGINSEFGFDYLRDNMVSERSQMVQRGFHYAVVDEVDSVLIDEARTPHIISAPDSEPTRKYYDYAKIVGTLEKEVDYTIDEKLKTAHLTEDGITKVEQQLGVDNLYEKDFGVVHHIEAALKARTLFRIDKEYVVRDGQVIIVDEFTGRMLPGRRFSEGLHQAIEAKEGVQIQQESKTLATVSLQNYFRMYQKLAGMTGTASTEAEEFHKIYKLDVVVIPTNRPMSREDRPDLVYKTNQAKYVALAEEIAAVHKTGQPILVGTTSIEKNELLSKFLHTRGIPHQLLNAKNHEREAHIIEEAGKKGAVTVATNMAGRGVDIILGGLPPNRYEATDKAGDKAFQKLMDAWKKDHDEVIALGGLYVIGTERHESRRIDNQLRGRAGRQGDPGASRFYVALDDEIMRLFGGEQVARLMTIFKLPDDVPLEHGMVSRAIQQAQVKVEGFHFDSRKHLVEYDDVLNKQREIVYSLRRTIVAGDNLREMMVEKLEKQIATLVSLYSAEEFTSKEKDMIMEEFISIIPFDPGSAQQLRAQLESLQEPEKITEMLTSIARDIYDKREKELGPDVLRQVEKWVAIGAVDNLWMEHLDAIDDLREGIGLRGYGQRDPLVEYKNEAFNMFERLVGSIDYEITHRMFKIQVQMNPAQSPVPTGTGSNAASPRDNTENTPTKKMATKSAAALMEQQTPIIREAQRIATKGKQASAKTLGRNDPCPCGSGKKWKKCHYPNLP